MTVVSDPDLAKLSEAHRHPPGQSPRSGCSQAYLVSQGVRMTDLAREYRTGTAAAGPGAQTLSARHTAGMTAVLTNHQRREVVGELKRHYAAIEDWILWITEPRAAAGHLTNLGALADLLSGFDESGYGE